MATKILNIALVLTFTVGQIQYAYTTYFCSMKNIPVSPTEATCDAGMAPSDRVTQDMDITGSCDLQKNLPALHQAPFVERVTSSSCCSLKLISKNVVDNFTDFQNHIITYLPTSIFAVNALSATTTFLPLFVQAIQPSPPDIITLQGTFRI